MSRSIRGTLVGIFVAAGLSQLASAAPSKEENKAPAAPAPAAANPAPSEIPAPTADESALTNQDREVRTWANAFAAECGKMLDQWIDSKAISEERLFARLYYQIPNTNPAKFKTDYDALADRDIGPIQERYLAKSIALSYVVLSDINGYVPTHNQKYSQPLTGNLAVDLVNNRTKRIFMTTVGFRSARSEAPFLLQVNERDNGERDLNLSVPVRVHGKHWGAVRFGYRPAEK